MGEHSEDAEQRPQMEAHQLFLSRLNQPASDAPLLAGRMLGGRSRRVVAYRAAVAGGAQPGRAGRAAPALRRAWGYCLARMG